jgi:hypothetical protein
MYSSYLGILYVTCILDSPMRWRLDDTVWAVSVVSWTYFLFS